VNGTNTTLPVLSSATATATCPSVLWILLIALAVWVFLILLKPSFILNRDGSINYVTVFWITLLLSVVGLIALYFYGGMCLRF
jgi:hypothetical protein